jgi:putative ABC transport system permease protein
VRVGNVIHLYRVRLRARALQELLALVGIAAGVALLLASQIAASSLSGSVGSLNSGIVGKASLQLTARSAQGFPESTLEAVRRIPGVRVAAPLLEVGAQAIGPRGSESVQLVGADPSLAQLGGALVRKTNLTPFAGIEAVVLPSPLAHHIGVTRFGQTVTFKIAGHTAEAGLYTQLSAKKIGGLAASPIAIAPLTVAQEMAGYGRTISRILVQTAPGATASVRSALVALAGGRLDVKSASYEQQLFAKAAEATNQSTDLFAAISALVGFLFAFNATLLTVPQRRRLIADLRRDGYAPRAVIAILLVDALLLGALACAVGLVLGDELSIHLFHSTPGYLSSAFAIGGARVVSAQSIIVAIAGGMLAAGVAVLSPLRDILSRDPLAAIAPPGAGSRARGGLVAGVGLLGLAASVAIQALAPSQALLGMVCLTLALLALMALPLGATVEALRRIAPAILSAVPHVATMELRAARGRALAIAATGAVAVFGSVAIEGAHGDLLRGLEAAARETNAITDLWVAPAGSYDRLFTTPFAPTALSRLRALPGVREVRLYRGGLMNIGDRRVWVIAPPLDASPLLPASQLLQGDPARAAEQVRGGNGAVLSQALAKALGLHVGERFTLPAPNPVSLRLAALSTNIGWAPGAVILGSQEFARAWGSPDASAYNLLLTPGASRQRVAAEVRRALGGGSGLAVQSASARAADLRAVSRQGLTRLSQIATLILVAAVLAMAAAMGTMVWQRRPRLAKLKLEGFSPNELWCTVLLESAVLLGVGCLSGALAGLLGQQLLDKALSEVINYPVIASVAVLPALVSLGLVTAAAVAIVAAPGFFAARVPAGLALQD